MQEATPENSLSIQRILLPTIALSLMAVIYSVTLLTLDYTFTGSGFSPFKIWSPFQTAFLAIIGLLLLAILFIRESHKSSFNLKGIIHFFPVFGLSFLVLFSIDSRQVLQYIPAIQPLLFDDYSSLFLYGGILGVYLVYLLFDNIEKLEREDSLIALSLGIGLVLFVGPLSLGMLLAVLISILTIPGFVIVPFYGEGTIGSILVISVLLSMYIMTRLLNFMQEHGYKPVKSLELEMVVEAIFEFSVALICTIAGFSLIGGLVTDGVPLPELVPVSIVILGMFAIIPFSLLLIRHKIFKIPSE
jgi:hypothetical protein